MRKLLNWIKRLFTKKIKVIESSKVVEPKQSKLRKALNPDNPSREKVQLSKVITDEKGKKITVYKTVNVYGITAYNRDMERQRKQALYSRGML